MSIRKNKTIKKYILIAISIAVCLYSLVPLLWAFRISIISKTEMLKSPPDYFPRDLTLENYRDFFGIGDSHGLIARNFSDAFINSIVSCLMATIIITLIAVFSGYVFARWEFRGRDALFGVLLMTMALPAYSVMLPLYRIMIALNLMDTITGVVLIYVSAYMPLAIWIMRSFFMSIPIEIEEAAFIDGASRLGALRQVIPLVIPGIIASAIISFLSTWSQYAIPLVFSASKTKPITVFLTTLIGKTSINYGLLAAGGIISIIAPMLIVVVLNKFLIQGLTKGAVK